MLRRRHALRTRFIPLLTIMVVAVLTACGAGGDRATPAPASELTAGTPTQRASATVSPSATPHDGTGDGGSQATEPTDDVDAEPTATTDEPTAVTAEPTRTEGTARPEEPAPTETPTPEEERSDEDGRQARPVLARGDEGAAVERLQKRLKDLRYWVGPVDGVFGDLTEQAVFALQGVEGLTIDGIVGPDTWSVLETAQPPEPRSDSGDLIEVDENARVVLDVRDGRVRWAWHTSTGTNEHYQHPAGHTALAETPNGRHTIDWQVDGWRRNELGRLWRPKYFHADGIAIHGFHSVPATPSSHGCVRVTIPAMNFIWRHDIAPEGSTVWVYGRAP